jgi:Protease inhibitor Inh
MLILNRAMHWGVTAGKAGGALFMLLALGACASTSATNSGLGTSIAGPPPDQASAAPAPPPPAPPPIDLAGRWKLSVAGGSACAVTLGDSAGASEGSIAPAGGCPGRFFTSRKWTFEHDRLIIRDHKGEVLVELSFADGHFQGQGTAGAAVTLTR